MPYSVRVCVLQRVPYRPQCAAPLQRRDVLGRAERRGEDGSPQLRSHQVGANFREAFSFAEARVVACRMQMREDRARVREHVERFHRSFSGAPLGRVEASVSPALTPAAQLGGLLARDVALADAVACA